MGCITGKQGYATVELAEQALNFARLHAKAEHRKAPIRWFYCEECGRYHLTSQKKKGK